MRTVMLMIVLGIVGLSEYGYATTYYSQPGGSGTNCTQAQNPATPRPTITLGANCLSSGDTLIVKDGTYNECLADVIPQGINASQPTIVKAENIRQAVLAPSSSVVGACSTSVILLGIRGDLTTNGIVRHYITLDGLKLNIPTDVPAFGVKPQGGIEDGSISGAHDLQFLNMEISGGKNSGNTDSFTIGVGQAGNMYGWTFRNNYVHDIGTVDADNPSATAWSYCWYVSGSDNLFEGNECVKASGFGLHGYSTSNHFHRNIIRNNYFHDIGGPGILVCGSDNQVYNNIVARVGVTVPHGGYRGGIRLAFGCSGVAANNNLIYNNTILWSQSPGGGSPSEGCINLSMPPVQDCGCSPANGNVVRNNICYQAAANINDQNGSNTVDHNVCVNGTGVSSCTTGDPLLTGSIGNSDLGPQGITPTSFQLQPGSPARDVGVSTAAGAGQPITFTTDYGGAQRLQGSAQDFGAWEFGAQLTQGTGPFYIAPPPLGSDARDCDTAKVVTTPKATFASVIPCMAQSATLNVMDGNYAERVDSGVIAINGGTSWASPTMIVRYNGTPTLQPTLTQSQNVVNFTAPANQYIVVNGLILDAGSNGSAAVFVGGSAHHIRFEGITAKRSVNATVRFETDANELLRSTVQTNQVNWGAVVLSAATNSLVDGNDVSGYVGGGIVDYNYAGPSTNQNNVVRNNKVHHAGSGNSEAGLVTGRGSGALFYNNVVYSGQYCMKAAVSASGPKFYHTTCFGNSSAGGFTDSGASSVVMRNNILEGYGVIDNGSGTVFAGNACSATATGCNNVGPLNYVNAASGDFHLASGSVAIENGVDLTEVPTDIVGVSRPQGVHWDAGAYEFVGGTGPVQSTEVLLRMKPYGGGGVMQLR